MPRIMLIATATLLLAATAALAQDDGNLRTYAEKVCQAWAADDQISAADLPQYLENCINEVVEEEKALEEQGSGDTL